MEQVISSKVANLERSATDEVDNIVKRMLREGVDDIISLGSGEPCFDTPRNIQDAAERAMRDGMTKYQPTTGAYEFRDAIATKFAADNGIDVTPDEIIVTPGGKFAIFLAFQTVLGPGDRVMVLEPAWVSYRSMAQLAGAEAVSVPCRPSTGYQPDLDALEAAMDGSVKIVVASSPNNPTGAVYEEASLRTMAELAQRHGALMLCDEVYEYLLYEGQHYSPARDYDHVITVNSLSKSHAMTGWRLGFATGPRDVLEGMTKIYQHSATCVTAFAQAGGIEALTSTHSRVASQEMIAGYRERRDLTVELLDASEFFDCMPPQGAFYAFPTYRLEMPSLELATRLMEEAHVATVPGSDFGACGEGSLRLCYSTSVANIHEAFHRMETLMQELA